MPAGPFIRIPGHVAAKQIAMAAGKGFTLALLAGLAFKVAVMDHERDEIARHYEMLRVKGGQK